jgi:hypothetical protein
MNTTPYNTEYIDAHWNGEEWLEVQVTIVDGVKTKRMLSQLTDTPTRGYLTSVDSYDEVSTVTGWFHSIPNSNGIARRKVGGRNTYLFTTQGRLIEFVADPKAK